MNSAFKKSIFILLLLIPSLCQAEDGKDNWFGKDKFRHFGYSAFLAGSTFAASQRHFDNSKDDSFAISVSITFSFGAAKEIIDYNKPGQTASVKDLVFDLAGALTGASLVSLLL